MTRVVVILLLLGVVLGLAFALTYRSPRSLEGVGHPRGGAGPAASRELGSSTLSHGGPTQSGASAGSAPRTPHLEGREAPEPDQRSLGP